MEVLQRPYALTIGSSIPIFCHLRLRPSISVSWGKGRRPLRNGQDREKAKPCPVPSICASLDGVEEKIDPLYRIRKSRGYDMDRSQASNERRMLFFSLLVPFLVLWHQKVKALDISEGSFVQDMVRKSLSKAKAAGMLRLAFHDAGTFDLNDNSGGMNGSIIYELDRPENYGLSKSLKILEKAKIEIDKFRQVSWADLIAVAGAEAVSLCGGPAIPIQLGRVDVRTPDPQDRLPLETLDASALKNCFQMKGFSIQELVALSGAHTIGSKGFGNPNSFDNAYFKILLDRPWTFSAGMSSMIGLPSDRALVEDEECLRWITIYAGDQAKFFYDFKNAYIKLVNAGASWRSPLL